MAKLWIVIHIWRAMNYDNVIGELHVYGAQRVSFRFFSA